METPRQDLSLVSPSLTPTTTPTTPVPPVVTPIPAIPLFSLTLGPLTGEEALLMLDSLRASSTIFRGAVKISPWEDPVQIAKDFHDQLDHIIATNNASGKAIDQVSDEQLDQIDGSLLIEQQHHQENMERPAVFVPDLGRDFSPATHDTDNNNTSTNTNNTIPRDPFLPPKRCKSCGQTNHQNKMHHLCPYNTMNVSLWDHPDTTPKHCKSCGHITHLHKSHHLCPYNDHHIQLWKSGQRSAPPSPPPIIKKKKKPATRKPLSKKKAVKHG